MAWITLTEAHLLTRLSGPELEALRQAALGNGQADPVQPTLDQVTRYVRSRVAACAANRLATGSTIPDELLDAALALVVVRLMPRAGGLMIDPSDARAKAAELAENQLKDTARCLLALEQPSAVEVSGEVVTDLPSPTFGERTRDFTRARQDG